MIVILAFGGLINEYISRKPIKSKDLEDLIRKISFSTNVDQMKEEIANSDLFDYQKEVLTRIADNHDIGPEARKAFASELISAEETRLIKKTNKTDIIGACRSYFGSFRYINSIGSWTCCFRSVEILQLLQSP